VPGTGEPGRLRPDLGEEDLGQASLDCRNGLQSPEVSFVGAQTLTEFGPQPLNRFIQGSNVGQMPFEQEAVMRRQASLEGLF
jgi:hypothetical protein